MNKIKLKNLAEEISIEIKDILIKCNDLSIIARSSESIITDEEAEKIRVAFLNKYSVQNNMKSPRGIFIEEREPRSFFGKIVKLIFIIFNILMLFWVIAGTVEVAKMEVDDQYEQLGQSIGYFIGMTMILSLWAFGDIIMGILVLFTRGKKRYIEKSK